MKTVEKFCCCCELEKGSKIISIIGIIGSILSFLNLFAPQNNAGQDSVLNNLPAQIIAIVIELVACILLAMGAYQKKRSFVFAYLTITAITIVIGIACGIFVTVVCFIHSIGVGFGVLVIFIIFFSISIYIWICVYSFYKQLQTRLP